MAKRQWLVVAQEIVEPEWPDSAWVALVKHDHRDSVSSVKDGPALLQALYPATTMRAEMHEAATEAELCRDLMRHGRHFDLEAFEIDVASHLKIDPMKGAGHKPHPLISAVLHTLPVEVLDDFCEATMVGHATWPAEKWLTPEACLALWRIHNDPRLLFTKSGSDARWNSTLGYNAATPGRDLSFAAILHAPAQSLAPASTVPSPAHLTALARGAAPAPATVSAPGDRASADAPTTMPAPPPDAAAAAPLGMDTLP